MKIHSICLVKDEADCVGDSIFEASKWSDYVYIFDNGSTDGTTEILKDLSRRNDSIIFYKWSDQPFEDTIRGEVFHSFKRNAQMGDWWCRLDADEFYIDNPRHFLQEIADGSNTVFHSSFNYYFTDIDLKNFKENPEDFSYKDLRYYKNNWSEIRFVKDNGHLYWPPSSSWPLINMNVYSKKIRVRHYQYRGPKQIQKRVRNRKKAYNDAGKFWHDHQGIGYLDNSALLDVEKRIVSHKALHYDDGEKPLVENESVSTLQIKDTPTDRFKVSLKNFLHRLNVLQHIYTFLGKNQ